MCFHSGRVDLFRLNGILVCFLPQCDSFFAGENTAIALGCGTKTAGPTRANPIEFYRCGVAVTKRINPNKGGKLNTKLYFGFRVAFFYIVDASC